MRASTRWPAASTGHWAGCGVRSRSASALFARAIGEADVPLLGMATGESLACLNYLMKRGEAVRETDAEGVSWYSMAAAPA